jgi:hypothetical protein
MIELKKKWQGALIETTDARILICESSLFTPLPPSWWPFVISKNNTRNQTFAKLLGKIFQKFTMKKTLDNHYGNSIALFARNKKKFKDNKNQNFHNSFSNNVLQGHDMSLLWEEMPHSPYLQKTQI